MKTPVEQTREIAALLLIYPAFDVNRFIELMTTAGRSHWKFEFGGRRIALQRASATAEEVGTIRKMTDFFALEIELDETELPMDFRYVMSWDAAEPTHARWDSEQAQEERVGALRWLRAHLADLQP